MTSTIFKPWTNRGFTLVEMAIVLIIVTVLMGGLMAGLTSQYDSRAQAQTQQTFADIREALLGFAVAKGRLPCPAAPPNAGGTELPDGGSVPGTVECTNALNGYVPGTTLGITPTDNNGYVLDGWNRPIRYVVTKSDSNAFTNAASGNMKAVTIANLNPNLTVCSSLNGSACAANATLTGNAVGVIYSSGKNGAGGGTDESKNYDNDRVFVSHDPAVGGSGGNFDDIVTWISPYTLYSRMITAGQLP